MSEDALVHLKSYKYSSVDKSFISNYILKHYVRDAPYPYVLEEAENCIVECLRGTSATMAGA